MKNLFAALLLFATMGCATGGGPPGSVGQCANCGTVRGVDLMNQSGQTSGAGALMGAVGGAVAGNEMERRRNSGSFYRITVDMDRGDTQSVNVANAGGLRSGSRVRVVGRNVEILER